MFEKLSNRPIAEVQNEQSDRWEREDLLGQCIREREDAPTFVFYEGPPTANGKPGIHHVMARSLKDSVCRYKNMKGYKVKRKAGWDTHGLPVEIEVEKKLNMTGKQDIEKYGIREFNEKCRESVFEYESLWREMSRRMGYMIDLDNPYITLDNNYIETGWWILKKFFDAGLIYEGHKILPYCPRCGTGLASHEVAQGYKEVKTNTLTAKFKLKNKENEYFLAWTTTPWTLPSNIALAVGPEITYVKAKQGDDIFYVAQSLADRNLGAGKYEVLETLKGKDLEYTEYEQLMPFLSIDRNDRKGFFVGCADYVDTEEGTGIVHIAPAFGDDDNKLGRKYNLQVFNPVDETGKFTDTPWKGRFVMEDGLDVDIIKYLAGENKLYSKEKVMHNYPHCWRCGTPLIYYAKPSWYIEMTKLRDQLVENNNTVNWQPPFVGEGRFGNWIADVKDWAISRNRYWGTPIPIWRCECGHTECVGSREELFEKALEKFDKNTVELHRPYVDEIHLSCPDCGKEMTRITEVMDCWFDSGSMPFAQQHYPFENKEEFESQFPADFICEGVDQTRGWFYSLLAISTFITGKAPYKNVLVNDLILDKTGKKMSKSKGNTVDPFKLFDQYGADVARWYLLYGSPAWTPTKFDEDGVREMQNKYFGTLKNVYNFFTLYANTDDIDVASFQIAPADRPELDRWILSKYNRLVRDVTAAMDAYEHMKAVRAITDFVAEDLSNWYVRRARRRFYAEELDTDKKSVYQTVYEVLKGVSLLSAPFAPFLSDEMYVKLTGEKSVHLADYPVCDENLIDDALEHRMDLVRTISTLGRGEREKENLKVRQPLSRILVDGKYEQEISDMTDLLREELNVREVVFEHDMGSFMNYSLKPDFRAAGPVLGKKIKEFGKQLAEANAAEVSEKLSADHKITLVLDGEETEIPEEFVDVRISAKEGFAVGASQGVFVILDTTVTPELIGEGLARELISKVQQMRKALDLDMMDHIEISVNGDADVQNMIGSYREYITGETLADEILMSDAELEKVSLNGHDTGIAIRKL